MKLIDTITRGFFFVALVVKWVTGSNLCPNKCKCDDVNLIVTCIRADLENMPNTLHPRLKIIIYKYNNFPTVDVSFKFLPELLKVDLSHNKIISVAEKAFSRQKLLQELKLEGNKINSINNNTFYGLINLKVLNLRGNIIEELPKNLFIHSINLIEIDLAKNRISIVHPDAFSNLPQLNILRLDGNFLSVLPFASLSQSVHLAELFIGGNSFSFLPKGAFSSFSSLSSLDLSSSSLSQLHSSSFEGLVSLRKLKLSDNNLTFLPSQVLSLPNLEELYMGQNPFVTLTNDALRHLRKLRILDLSGCASLQRIGPFFLQGSETHLEKLVISENRHLKEISSELFGDSMPFLHKLKSLDLASNGLTSISSQLFPWSHLKHLDVSGNPWNCDCHLLFLRNVLRSVLSENSSSSSIPDSISSTQCLSPKFLSSRSLYSLETFEMSGDCSSSSFAGGLVHGETSKEKLIIIISVVTVILVLFSSVGVFAAFKCRKNFSNWMFKEYRWKESSSLSHEESLSRKAMANDYSKTYRGDQDFFIQLAHQGSRPIPVTEL